MRKFYGPLYMEINVFDLRKGGKFEHIVEKLKFRVLYIKKIHS